MSGIQSKVIKHATNVIDNMGKKSINQNQTDDEITGKAVKTIGTII